MVNLYTLPSWEILLFIVVSMVLFLVNSVLYYFLMPQAEFSHLGRKCLEGSSLILLLAVMAVFYEILRTAGMVSFMPTAPISGGGLQFWRVR